MPSLFLLFFFGRKIKNLIIIHLSLHSEVAWFHYLTDLLNSCSPQRAPSSLFNYKLPSVTLKISHGLDADCLTEYTGYFLFTLFVALHLFQSPEVKQDA